MKTFKGLRLALILISIGAWLALIAASRPEVATGMVIGAGFMAGLRIILGRDDHEL